MSEYSEHVDWMKRRIRELEAALAEQQTTIEAQRGTIEHQTNIVGRLTEERDWYKNWAVITLARERGGLWSNRDDKERAALKLEAEVDLERTRKTGGYR
jgi:hypothetical protein